MQGDTGVPAGSPTGQQARCPHCRAFVAQEGAPCQNPRCPSRTGWRQRLEQERQAQLRSGSPREAAAAVTTLGASKDRRYLPVLLASLTASAWEVRQAAVRALGELGTREAVPALAQVLLEGPDLFMKTDAAMSLQRLGGRQAVTALAQALAAAPEVAVRRDVAAYLGRLGDAATAGAARKTIMRALLPALQDSDGEVRQEAATALARAHDQRAVPALVALYQGETEPKVRAAAVRAVGVLAPDQATPLLRQAVQDPDATVRLAAVETTRHLDRTAAGWLLMEKLDDPAVEVRQAVLQAMWQRSELAQQGQVPDFIRQALLQSANAGEQAFNCKLLGYIKGDQARQLLTTILDTTPADQVAAAAAESLGLCGGPAAITRLRQVATTDNDERFAGAVRGLEAVGDAPAIAALADLLQQEEEPQRRVDVVRALGRTGRTEAAAPLAAVLQNEAEVQEVQAQAAEALGKTGSPDAPAALMGAAENAALPPYVRISAITALSLIRGVRLEPLLRPLLQTQPPAPVREAVAQALAQDRSPEALALVGELLQDGSADVRHIAAARLGHVGGEQAAQLLAAALDTYPEHERGTLLYMLSHIQGQQTRSG